MEAVLQKVNYGKVRRFMKSGDDVLFSGRGGFSELIKTGTKSVVSHIESVYITEDYEGTKRVKLIGSTSLEGKTGVQTSFLSDRIQSYDGIIYWAPLSDKVRKFFDQLAFLNFMFLQEGKDYEEYLQVFLSAIDIPLLTIDDNKEDFQKLFCSELRTGALEEAFHLYFDWLKFVPNPAECCIPELERFRNINASEITPSDCAAQNIHAPIYYQLTGDEPQPIKEFNSGKWMA